MRVFVLACSVQVSCVLACLFCEGSGSELEREKFVLVPGVRLPNLLTETDLAMLISQKLGAAIAYHLCTAARTEGLLQVGQIDEIDMEALHAGLRRQRVAKHALNLMQMKTLPKSKARRAHPRAPRRGAPRSRAASSSSAVRPMPDMPDDSDDSDVLLVWGDAAEVAEEEQSAHRSEPVTSLRPGYVLVEGASLACLSEQDGAVQHFADALSGKMLAKMSAMMADGVPKSIHVQCLVHTRCKLWVNLKSVPNMQSVHKWVEAALFLRAPRPTKIAGRQSAVDERNEEAQMRPEKEAASSQASVALQESLGRICFNVVALGRSQEAFALLAVMLSLTLVTSLQYM